MLTAYSLAIIYSKLHSPISKHNKIQNWVIYLMGCFQLK